MKNFAIIINFEKKRALYEEIRKKNYPDLDALPLTYDWEMLRYNCWDDQKMIRNFGKTTDVCETLIRIIIKDNRIVGVTLKSALGVSRHCFARPKNKKRTLVEFSLRGATRKRVSFLNGSISLR